MRGKDAFWGVVEFIVWILFVYYLLYSIKNPVNLWLSAVVLVVLAYVAAIACPIFRATKAFKTVYKRK